MISSAYSSNMSSARSCSLRSLIFLSSSLRSRRAFRASIAPLFSFRVSVTFFIYDRLSLIISRRSLMRFSKAWPSSLALNSIKAYCLSIASRFCLTAPSNYWWLRPSSSFAPKAEIRPGSLVSSFKAEDVLRRPLPIFARACSSYIYLKASGSYAIYLLIASTCCCVFLYCILMQEKTSLTFRKESISPMSSRALERKSIVKLAISAYWAWLYAA